MVIGARAARGTSTLPGHTGHSRALCFMKILLVEDDAPLGRSLLQVLTDQGHATMWLRELAPARQHLLADSFDLLLLDIVLPDGSGLNTVLLAGRWPHEFVLCFARWRWSPAAGCSHLWCEVGRRAVSFFLVKRCIGRVAAFDHSWTLAIQCAHAAEPGACAEDFSEPAPPSARALWGEKPRIGVVLA
jgi:hypothetical protein